MIARHGLVVALGVAALAGPALADGEDDPCGDAIVDPVPTPLRDAAIDAQRGACLRDEVAARLLASALIDTPGFHGVLGGDLRVRLRKRVGERLELSAGVRAVRYTFAQTAVNQATAVGFGPVLVGGAWAGDLGAGARVALAGTLELPLTRDDPDTVRIAGELGAVVTARLARRTVLNARLGAIALRASSAGGDTHRLALRSGVDVARRIGTRLALHGGADLQAGWYEGADHVLVRAGAQVRIAVAWRLAVGVGVPIAGEERTTALLDVGIVRELW